MRVVRNDYKRIIKRIVKVMMIVIKDNEKIMKGVTRGNKR